MRKQERLGRAAAAFVGRGGVVYVYAAPVLIDLHSHLLPGLDDGARTLDESREIARRAAAEGVTAMAATPHVREDHPTTADAMEAALAEVRADFTAAGVPVQVLPGGEVSVEFVRDLPLEELSRFSLAGSGRYLLVETPNAGWPLGLEQTVFELAAAGLVAVLAHPERNPEAQARPELVEAFVRAGGLVQVTAASVDGRFGRRPREASLELLARGLVHVLASDAHTPDVREAGLAAAVDALGDRGLARYLVEEAPAAIVAGEPVASPPALKRRRGLRFPGWPPG